jgi:hypothetical protein
MKEAETLANIANKYLGAKAWHDGISSLLQTSRFVKHDHHIFDLGRQRDTERRAERYGRY